LARRKTKQPLQGNLDPDLLFAPKETIRKTARDLLASMEDDPAFIAGLGHGMKPDAPFDAAKMLIEALQGR
jgi:uroporphyrinogen decarboxylase